MKLIKLKLNSTYAFEIIDKDGWCIVGGYNTNPIKAFWELLVSVIKRKPL